MDEQRCGLCGAQSKLIASQLGVCLDCIRKQPEEALSVTSTAHARARRLFHLPETAPAAEDGPQCVLCFRQCRIPEGGRGFCGMRTVKNDRLIHMAGTPKRGLLHWYRDPLPTNCVADWICSGHEQYGHHNLAVFYASCTLDCLFCQNWHYRETDPTRDRQGTVKAMSSLDLARAANLRTHCVCFFGGDPASPDTYGKFYADIEMYTNTFDGTDPESYMGNWVCSEISGPDNQWLGNNIPRWCNPTYEGLVETMAETVALEQRAELAKQMNDMLMQDYVMIPLVTRGDVSSVHNTLLGVRFNVWDSEIWNIADWSRASE